MSSCAALGPMTFAFARSTTRIGRCRSISRAPTSTRVNWKRSRLRVRGDAHRGGADATERRVDVLPRGRLPHAAPERRERVDGRRRPAVACERVEAVVVREDRLGGQPEEVLDLAVELRSHAGLDARLVGGAELLQDLPHEPRGLGDAFVRGPDRIRVDHARAPP